ncbi:glycosyltransferase family 4 protein [uncultured Methylobacterium sp.]|uniref:glycosyltransferase family 4 protein n=1 Tax=uncultured Methylobacterium sp. TaxID=157278 RepID=UPI0035CB2589
MRILHLTSLYQPEQVGGAELMVETLVQTQAGLGHALGVACLSRRAQGPDTADGTTIYRVGHGTPFHVLDWAEHGRLSRLRYKLAAQWGGRTLAAIEAALRDFRPDVVNTHSMSELTPRLWPMLARLGVPVVHTLHDFTSLCTNGAMVRDGRICDRPHAKCRAYALPHRLCQHSVDAVIGVGEDILARHLAAGFFRAVPPALRQVIWNPIVAGAPPPAERGAPAAGVTFGYMGRIEPSKGVDVLLDACRRLPPSGWRLGVAGRAVDGLDRYRGMAAGLPIDFPGFVARDAFLDGIDCLVVPPVWPEAFGRTVAEAYARNVPVIGTAVGGIAEQVGANADWLVPPGDSEALAAAMARVVADPARLALGLRNAPAVRAATRPEIVAARYLDLYRTLLNREPVSAGGSWPHAHPAS